MIIFNSNSIFLLLGRFFQSNRARMCCFPSSPVLLSPCPPRNTLAISFCCKDIDSISFYFCIYSPLDFILLYFCAKITTIFHISKLFEKKVLYYMQIPLESLSSVDPIIILQLPIEGWSKDDRRMIEGWTKDDRRLNGQECDYFFSIGTDLL